MKKHVLILGSGGMLGHVINVRLRSLSDQFYVTDVARNENAMKPSIKLDVTEFPVLKKLIHEINPDVIINCIGILNTNAENNPANAILINSFLPHYLEKLTNDTSTRLIHISTDCVFSGKKGSYSEFDFRDADGYYGRSKALGEIQNNKDLTIRTSIIGPELHENGIGLFQWFSQQKDVIQGFTDVYWTGVTTIELSNFIIESINESLTGLFHLVNGHKISKFELLTYFKKTFQKSKITFIEKNNNLKYDKSLINNRIDSSYHVPNYEQMISEMKEWIIKNKDLYPHYHGII